MQKTKTGNRQVLRTKGWITEALFLLLDEKPYDKISISDIAEKAGVVRQTFYHNFESKDDIILQYLESNINNCLVKAKSIISKNRRKSIVVTFSINHAVAQQKRLKKIFNSGLAYLVVKSFQSFGETVLSPYKGWGTKEEKSRMRYSFIFLFAGLTGVLFDWLQNDMPFTPEKLSGLFQEFMQPFEERIDNTITLLIEGGNAGVPQA
jgi:AcrR family transcriptional regulator